MKATEQYFPVVLFIMLYKVVLTFESLDKILKCDHSNGGSICVTLHVSRTVDLFLIPKFIRFYFIGHVLRFFP